MHDIVISKIKFDGDRQKTAKCLAEQIQKFLAELELNKDWYGPLQLVDKPMSTNVFNETCVAFARFSNVLIHRDFVERFNSRILFRGSYLTLRLSSCAPKSLEKFYIFNNLAWVNPDSKTIIASEPKSSSSSATNGSVSTNG